VRKAYAATLLLLLLMQSPSAGQEVQSGTSTAASRPAGATVLVRMDAVDLAKPVAISLESLEGMKLAFQAKGTADAKFTLRDDRLGKDIRPQRGVWRLTGTSPHVKGYQWGGGNLTPCLYRMDLFGQDAMYWRKNLGKPAEGRFTRLDFARPGLKESLEVRNLVVYRGEDTAAPEAPSALAAKADADGVHLTWKAARDDVGTALYVISRAGRDAKFEKIAQTAELEYTDKPPSAGAYRYRVLAADYERNLGPWSSVVSGVADKGFELPEPSSLVKDSQWYAKHVRDVHEMGVGKISKGVILHHGDCLLYLDRARNFVAGLTGLQTYGSVNSSSGCIKPSNPSSLLLAELPKELELRPEFCVISAGMEDLHPKPWPEDARLTPEDRKKTVDNVLEMVRLCERRGTVPIVATLTPFGHAAPKDSPEEKLSDELAAMCRANEIPIARVFDLFRKAQDAGEDYKLLMTEMGRTDVRTNSMWPRGYEFDPYTPSFELGITRRFIVVKETLDQVMFVLLDRPD
jgi:hypothetical protein